MTIMTIEIMNQALDHIKKGKLEELRKCITNVENINKSNRNGENLLHLAVIYCKDNIGEKNRTITTKQIFELLIEKGVSVQQKNNQDVTPLTIARNGMNISNQEEIIAILEEADRNEAQMITALNSLLDRALSKDGLTIKEYKEVSSAVDKDFKQLKHKLTEEQQRAFKDKIYELTRKKKVANSEGEEAKAAVEQKAEADQAVAREKEEADQAADQEAAAYQEAQKALDNAARTFKQKSGVVTLQNKIEAVSNVIVKLHKVNTTEWQLAIIGQEEDKMCVSSLSQAQQAKLKAQRVEQKVVEDIKKDDLTDLQLSHELKKALGRLQKVETTNEWLKSEATNVLAAAAKVEAQQKAEAKQAAEARSTAREKETAGQAAAQIQKLRTPRPSMKKNQATNSDANSIVGRGSTPKPQPHRFAEE